MNGSIKDLATKVHTKLQSLFQTDRPVSLERPDGDDHLEDEVSLVSVHLHHGGRDGLRRRRLEVFHRQNFAASKR